MASRSSAGDSAEPLLRDVERGPSESANDSPENYSTIFGRRVNIHPANRWKFLAYLIITLLLVIFVICVGVIYTREAWKKSKLGRFPEERASLVTVAMHPLAAHKRNVILMISDGKRFPAFAVSGPQKQPRLTDLWRVGFGPASQTMARNYYQVINNKPYGTQLPLDTILGTAIDHE